jgi:hypothetical protein
MRLRADTPDFSWTNQAKPPQSGSPKLARRLQPGSVDATVGESNARYEARSVSARLSDACFARASMSLREAPRLLVPWIS